MTEPPLRAAIQRTATDAPVLNDAFAASLGFDDPAAAADAARRAPRAGADTAAAPGVGRSLYVNGDAYRPAACQERSAPDQVHAPPRAGPSNAAAPHPGRPSNDAALPQDGGEGSSSQAGIRNAAAPCEQVRHTGMTPRTPCAAGARDGEASNANAPQKPHEHVPNLAADQTRMTEQFTRSAAGRKGNRDGADAAATPGSNATPTIRSTDKETRRRATPGASPAPRANKGGACRAVRKPPQKSASDAFGDEGYGLNMLFREAYQEDDVPRSYALYCWHRSQYKRDNKNLEVCDICFFKRGKIIPVMKNQIDRHCSTEHPEKTFVCTKKGCPVKCSSLGAAGLHNLYVHEQKLSDWWTYFL